LLDANELLPVAELTDASVPSFYTASFSPRAGFYLLSYDGPGVPWQRIVGAQGTASAGLNRLLTDNAELNATMQAFEMPLVSRFTIENDGFGTSIIARKLNRCRHP
jgi:dipeptidyl aminopeptidase B